MEPGMDLVFVQQGTFFMGTSYDDPDDDEQSAQPVRKVWLSAYKIQRTPVTVAQWISFCRSSKYIWPYESDLLARSPTDDCPALFLSWYDCCAFVDWLRYETGLPYTLPTEAQWEKAARAVKTPDWNLLGTSDTDSGTDKAPGAEMYRPAASGKRECTDLCERGYRFGEIWEWCSDWWAYYLPLMDPINPVGPTNIPPAPSMDYCRVIRGGRQSAPAGGRLFFRSYGSPEVRGYQCDGGIVSNTGFRVVLPCGSLPTQSSLALGGLDWPTYALERDSICHRIQLDDQGRFGTLALQDDSMYGSLAVFDGRSLAEFWQPFSAEVLGGETGDFALLRAGTFACSSSARGCIGGALGNEVEFLPIQVAGSPWYVLNILNVIDCFDEDTSDCVYSPVTRQVVGVQGFSIVRQSLRGTFLFRIPLFSPAEAFATASFVELYHRCGLTGIMFHGLPLSRWHTRAG